MTMCAQTRDVVVRCGGSVYHFTPLSAEAKIWADQNALESWQWQGGGFLVECRHFADLVLGMRGAGLTVLVGVGHRFSAENA